MQSCLYELECGCSAAEAGALNTWCTCTHSDRPDATIRCFCTRQILAVLSITFLAQVLDSFKALPKPEYTPLREAHISTLVLLHAAVVLAMETKVSAWWVLGWFCVVT